MSGRRPAAAASRRKTRLKKTGSTNGKKQKMSIQFVMVALVLFVICTSLWFMLRAAPTPPVHTSPPGSISKDGIVDLDVDLELVTSLTPVHLKIADAADAAVAPPDADDDYDDADDDDENVDENDDQGGGSLDDGIKKHATEIEIEIEIENENENEIENENENENEMDKEKPAGIPPPPPPPPPQVVSATIVNTYKHDPGAFTQGLTWYKETLFESTGLYGHSSLRKVELNSGRVLKNVQGRAFDRIFVEGITVWRNKMYVLTWKSRQAYVYSADKMMLMRRWTLPSSCKEGWGITHDRRHLILTDSGDRLFFVSPKNFQVVRSVQITARGSNNVVQPVRWANELEYYRGLVLANVWMSTKIAVIAPQTGKVVLWIDLAAFDESSKNRDAVANGIAYDTRNDKLHVTGKWWTKLHEIEIPLELKQLADQHEKASK